MTPPRNAPVMTQDRVCITGPRAFSAGPDLGGGGGGNRGGCPGPTAFEGAPHGAHNNDIHVFWVYSNSF